MLSAPKVELGSSQKMQGKILMRLGIAITVSTIQA
jgi:hypothetical protein